MPTVSHQTIRLSRGKHSSPAEGACVMELASMLAGERFSDQPVSVCPIIGSFLRAYNDAVGDDRRQDLYASAARVVGSRGSKEVENAREQRLSSWIGELQRRRWRRFFIPWRLLSFPSMGHLDPIGLRAVNAMPRRDAEMHAEVLALLDELLAIGQQDSAATSAGRPRRQPKLTPAAKV